MALIDVVKCEVNDEEFVYKFPSDDLRLGTQLVVYTAQTAFFVKGGAVHDEFQAGTHTLKSENIPLLNKLINLPFGSKSPFKAEVWFINQISKLDIKWGTPTPIQLEDPRYNVIVPVRAFGQYGIKVKDPRLFLETLIGNMTSFTAEKIEQYFKGKVLAQLSTLITQKIAKDNVSILDISGSSNRAVYTGTWIGDGFEIALYGDGTGTLKFQDVTRSFRWNVHNWRPTEAGKAEGYVANDFAHIYPTDYVVEIFLKKDGGWYHTDALKSDEKPAKQLKKQ